LTGDHEMNSTALDSRQLGLQIASSQLCCESVNRDTVRCCCASCTEMQTFEQLFYSIVKRAPAAAVGAMNRPGRCGVLLDTTKPCCTVIVSGFWMNRRGLLRPRSAQCYSFSLSSISWATFLGYDNKEQCHALAVHLHRVRKKNIPILINCHSKIECPILIIFGTNISGTTDHQMTV